MTIAVEVDFCKENISNFSDLAKAAFEYSLSFGRELVRRIVEERDAALREERDKARYVNKGKRKTCLKEMKVGIAYDGVLWSGGKSGKERRELHNKVALPFTR